MSIIRDSINGLKINQNLDYKFNPRHLETIIAILNQSKECMTKPIVGHFCLFITKDFDVKTIAPKIKSVLKKVPMNYVASVERSKMLHVHLMLVIECKDHENTDELFVSAVLPALEGLKNTIGCQFNLRVNEDSYYHDLSNPIDYLDAIQRYSYYAKTNQKKWVPASIVKAFNSSQIKDKKYYSEGDKSMFKINKIVPNKNFKFSRNKTINTNYVNFIKSKDADNKQCFHIKDSATQQVVGYYGLSHEVEAFESEQVLYLSIDGLYVTIEYIDLNWEDALYAHMKSKIYKLLSEARNSLTINQKLTVHTVVPEQPKHEALLSLVVNSVTSDSWRNDQANERTDWATD